MEMKDKERVIAKLNGNEEWKLIGIVCVDSGTLMVGDPCYFTDDSWTGKDYERELIDDGFDMFKQLNFELGHDGKGVIFSSGLGDGSYEVWALIKNYKDWGRRIKEVNITLIGDDDNN